MSTPHLVQEQEGPVAFLTFNRPEARNAMTWEMYQALADRSQALATDTSVKVIVLRGAGGKAFVAGTDISQFQGFSTPDDGLDYERRLDAIVDGLEGLTTPTIAAIDGVATGGGVAIAAACDLRICSTRSRLGIPIARTLGNCLSAANHARLVDLIGPARVKDILFTGRLLDASEALGAGLVNRVVEPDDLDDVVRDTALTIAANAPLTIRATKEMVARIQHQRRTPPVDGRDLIVSCYTSEDFREGVSAFLAKRPPQWKGR